LFRKFPAFIPAFKGIVKIVPVGVDVPQFSICGARGAVFHANGAGAAFAFGYRDSCFQKWIIKKNRG
jgi:hypothetical protein